MAKLKASSIILIFGILLVEGQNVERSSLIVFPTNEDLDFVAIPFTKEIITPAEAMEGHPSNQISFNIFPDEDEVSLRNLPEKKLKRNKPPCLQNSSYVGLCETDPEYDSDVRQLFQKALKKSNMSSFVFENIVSKILVDVIEQPSEISNRIRPDILGEPICPAVSRVIFPRTGMTRNKEYVFILNQDEMQQGVRVEECVLNRGRNLGRANRPETYCSILAPIGENAACEQKYIYRNMLTMDGSSITPQSILIPSCCVCRRIQVFNRFGGPAPSISNRNFRGLSFDPFAGPNFGENNGARSLNSIFAKKLRQDEAMADYLN